jgi:hypothetical protein
MGMKLAVLLLFFGCSNDLICAVDSCEPTPWPDHAAPADMTGPTDDLTPAPDLAWTDLAGGVDIAEAPRDMIQTNDMTKPPDLTPAPPPDLFQCWPSNTGLECQSPTQCCSGKCEVIGANPAACCALVGNRCGSAALGNCCAGADCTRISSIGVDDFTCCIKTTRPCPNGAGLQSVADCGNGPTPYGDCF